MDIRRALQMARGLIRVFGRCYAGVILCFFAFVPGWILFHGLLDISTNPRNVVEGDLKDLLLGFGVLTLCAALMYLLLLLAYRAFTNRGRKKDGGLLPPLAMQGFAALFALSGVAASAMGIQRQDVLVIALGLLHFLAGALVFRLSGARRRTSAR